MVLRFNKNIFMKSTAILLSLFLFIIPFFQPKKVKAVIGVDDAILVATIATALIAGRYVQTNVLYTPEQMNQINDKWTANLQTAFPDPDDYNHQMNVLQNLNQKLLNGEEVDWSKYSGKALYAVLKGVVDVVWPFTVPDNFIGTLNSYYILALKDGEGLLLEVDKSTVNGCPSINYLSSDNYGWNRYRCSSFNQRPSNGIIFYHYIKDGGHIYKEGPTIYPDSDFYFSSNNAFIKKMLTSSNVQKVPNITAKTANKVKLPTRLPQTVINNINNYIDGSSENLIVNPIADELPTLPDSYNPNTDDPPDLPGYEDVTPDQEPTPTPTPTPEPTPEPTPTPPDYDGSSWIKPIGDFFAGLLSFLKDALIPTQTVDFSPLQNMGADVSGKFPFSLPGDIGKLFGVLNAEPIRPHFEMDFDLSKVGIPGEPIHWDLNVEQWDNGAAVVKTALYIAFLIGLVFITKQFMQN